MEKLELCIQDIRQWMEQHYLKLNDIKTEFMMIGIPLDLEKTAWTITVGNSEILPSPTPRNIGAFSGCAQSVFWPLFNFASSQIY